MLSTLSMVMEFIGALLVVLALIYLSIKFGGNKLQSLQNGNYMKVLERVSLTKENNLFIVKLGEKAYVMSSTANKIEIMEELDKQQLLKLEESKKIPEYKDLKEFCSDFKSKLNLKGNDNPLLQVLKNKLKIKKEG